MCSYHKWQYRYIVLSLSQHEQAFDITRYLTNTKVITYVALQRVQCEKFVIVWIIVTSSY